MVVAFLSFMAEAMGEIRIKSPRALSLIMYISPLVYKSIINSISWASIDAP